MLTRMLILACAAVLIAGCSEVSSTTEPSPINVPVQFSAAQHAGEAHALSTHLSGREEVPARDTNAQGQAQFRFNDSGGIDFTLIVANIENVRQAHIHCGPVGSNGGITVWLYPAAPPAVLIPGRSQGILAEGTITADDVLAVDASAECPGGIAAGSFDDLEEKLRTGGTYVNVHTTQFMPGEIRGQID
jgi:hypothetical protein